MRTISMKLVRKNFERKELKSFKIEERKTDPDSETKLLGNESLRKLSNKRTFEEEEESILGSSPRTAW